MTMAFDLYPADLGVLSVSVNFRIGFWGCLQYYCTVWDYGEMHVLRQG